MCAWKVFVFCLGISGPCTHCVHKTFGNPNLACSVVFPSRLDEDAMRTTLGGFSF